MPVFAFLQK